MAEIVQEVTLIPRVPLFKGRIVSVLNVEFATYRHSKFRIKGAACYCRYVDDMKVALKDVQERDWDIIFLPGWYPERSGFSSYPGVTGRDLVKALLEKKNKPKLVIYTGYMDYQTDELKMLYQLRDAGILLAHVPWNHEDPSIHTRIPVPYPTPLVKE